MNTSTINRFERRKQRTRDQLKQAAITLILEKGFDEVSVQDITDSADLGRGTFYVHFNDKEDIVWTAVREGFDVLDQDIRQNYYGHEQSPRLEYLVWLLKFEYAAEHRDLFMVMFGGKGASWMTERIVEYLVAAMVEHMKDGSCFPHVKTQPEIYAQVVMGGLVRLIQWWLKTPNDYSPKQMADQFFEIIFQQPPPLIEA
ncbi:MAG: TetR/AcrR family transcriptional regulator [Anaerolineae bacterium]|nr:TetR/AcrR family transcriptional regulator [Anaerolineae bacterium]